MIAPDETKSVKLIVGCMQTEARARAPQRHVGRLGQKTQVEAVRCTQPGGMIIGCEWTSMRYQSTRGGVFIHGCPESARVQWLMQVYGSLGGWVGAPKRYGAGSEMELPYRGIPAKSRGRRPESLDPTPGMGLMSTEVGKGKAVRSFGDCGGQYWPGLLQTVSR